MRKYLRKVSRSVIQESSAGLTERGLEFFPSGNENAKKSYITLSNVARSPIISKIVITACFELNACFNFFLLLKVKLKYE